MFSCAKYFIKWIFDPKVSPGSCDKLRSYWAGPYKIVRLLAPALAEVMPVYEKRKPRRVSLDILKDFRGENNLHGLPSDPPPPSIYRGRLDYRNSKLGARETDSRRD